MKPIPAASLVKRELVSTLRRSRSFLGLCLVYAPCMLVVLAVWPDRNLSPVAAGSMSSEIFMALSTIMMAGSLLLIPGLAASTITSERQEETFDLLQLTLIRPSGVILAKLVNAVGFYVLVIIGLFPVVASLLFGLNFDWVQLVYTVALTLMTGVSAGLIGMVCAARFRRAFFALVASYIAILALAFGPILLVGFGAILDAYFGLFRGPVGELVGMWLGTIIAALSPVAALTDVLSGSMFSFAMKVPIAIINVVLQLVLCACLFLLARRWVYRNPRPAKIEGLKPIDDVRVLKARRRRFPFYLIDPLRRKPPIEDNRNPMLVREMRWGLFSRAATLVRLFYVAFPLFGFLLLFSIGETDALIILAAFEMVCVGAIAPTLLANSFTKEYELGNMDMLRMTLLSPRNIVSGKAVAGMVSLGPLLLAAVLPALLVLILVPGQWLVIVAGVVSLFVCALLALRVGLLASVLCKRTPAALVLGYVLTFLMFIGGYIAAEFTAMYMFEFRRAPGREYEHICALFSPIVSFVATFDLPPNPYAAFLPVMPLRYPWFLSTTVFAGVAFGIHYLTYVIFRDHRMRDK